MPRRSSRKRSNSDIPAEVEESASPVSRRSSRANKFASSFKEPDANSIRDLIGDDPKPSKKQKNSRRQSKADDDESSDEEMIVKRTSSSRGGDASSPKARRSSRLPTKSPKSPAVRHSATRKKIKLQQNVETDSEDESMEEESYASSVESEEEPEFKIQRIIAVRMESKKTWKEICKKINTSEIGDGSRWIQDEEEEDEDLEGFEERFLVKWADLSFLHCSWEKQDDLLEFVENAKTYLSTFFKKSHDGFFYDADERMDGDYFDPSFVQVERILEVNPPEGWEEDDKKNSKTESEWGMIFDKENEDYDHGTGRSFLVKWGSTPYVDATYEYERDLILMDIEYESNLEQFEQRSSKPSKSEMKKIISSREDERRRLYKIFGDKIRDSPAKEAKIEEYKTNLENNEFKNGGELRDYQAEGVSWLLSNHVNKRSAILADEMGLGKTIQTATYVQMICTSLKLRGPFLIVAPLSTIPHWQREFTGWTNLNTIVYHGSQNDREVIREFEFAYECDRPQGGVGINQRFLNKCHTKKATKAERIWMAQVVITTPEMLVTDDFSELMAVEWELLVVDEAHRLKSHTSKLAVNLRHDNFRFNHTLLLTGTPIQNNMSELWSLMNVIDPDTFDDCDEFMERYDNMQTKERVDELHELIRPYILRRLKEDVEKSVPPKEETLIEVEMTVLQKQYYRALYEKNVQFLHRDVKKALDGPSLNNLSMQLRKCCNHPFLLEGVEEKAKKDVDINTKSDEADFLAKASGKLVLLDKLLPKLQSDGHRVLLFSQFKIMLDIIEDYLSLREFKLERIDGSITGKKRQMAIDRFQSKTSSNAPFIMLLSTRAGGVGINLTAADTCIIFDSDWNPQNDLQAQARCHRIGQTKSVKVYRLLTRKTYEMQMFHMSSMKMGLDQAVLQGIEDGGSESSNLTKEEVEKLLRHGAYDMFQEENEGKSEKESNEFIEQDIDTILERRAKTVIHENTGSKSSAAGGTFSKASFKGLTGNEADQNGTSTSADVDIDDPDFWKKMVGEAKFEDEDIIKSTKKRSRGNVSYNENAFDMRLDERLTFSDEDSFVGSTDSNESYDPEGRDENALFDFDFDIDLKNDDLKTILQKRKLEISKIERKLWGGKSEINWKKSDAEIILKLLLRYGYGNLSWPSFIELLHAQSSKQYKEDEVKRMCWSMCFTAVKECTTEHTLDAAKRIEKDLKKKKEEKDADISRSNDGDEGDTKSDEKGDSEKDKQVKIKDEKEETSATDKKADSIPLGTESTKVKTEDKKSEITTTEKKPDQSLPDTKSQEWKTDQLKKSFAKYWEGEWIDKALSDAKEFMKDRESRSEDFSTENSEIASTLSLRKAFDDSIVPALKNRGWKESTTKSKGKRCKCMVNKNGTEFTSIGEILDKLPHLHPELEGSVASIIAKVKTEITTRNNVKMENNHLLSLNPKAASFDDIASLLHSFAPCQLLVDRDSTKKLNLSSTRLINTMTSLTRAHDLVNRAREFMGEAKSQSLLTTLTKLIDTNPKAALPHPSWKPIHDAILITAIVKHGWIDRDTHCRAITEDKEIKWGPPFDDASFDTSSPDRSEKEDVVMDGKSEEEKVRETEIHRSVAERAAAFMNNEKESIKRAKGFALDLVLKSYNIVSSQSGDESSDFLWKVDFEQSGHEPMVKDTNVTSSTKESETTDAELPTRKDLLRRAKLLLAKSTSVTPEKEESKTASKVQGSTPQFAVLDQSNVCNIFLAELLREAIKVGQKQQKWINKILTNAYQEAERRSIEYPENSAESTELKKIAKHIHLVKQNSKPLVRASKNVLRVILGMEVHQPSKQGEALFVTERKPISQVISRKSKATLTPKKTESKSSSNGLKSGSKSSQSKKSATKSSTKSATKPATKPTPKPATKKKSNSKKKKKKRDVESTVGDVAINKALTIGKYPERGINIPSQSFLKLTSIETLILSVLCSQGMPICDDDWTNTITCDYDEDNCQLSWFQTGSVLEAAAETWYKMTDSRLKRQEADGDQPTVTLLNELQARKLVYIEASNLRQVPVDLAKKAVMLLQAVFHHTGTRLSNCKKDPRLGKQTINWGLNHNLAWGSYLGVVVEGKVIPNYVYSNLPTVTPTAYVDEKGCEAIFCQIIQQTRLRNLFLKYQDGLHTQFLPVATNLLTQKEDEWGDRPAWWSDNADDEALINGILHYGYGGFDEMVRVDERFKEQTENKTEIPFDRLAAQCRLDCLTRELNDIETFGNDLNQRRDVVLRANLATQVGISSFFVQKPTKTDNDDSSVEILDATPKKRKSCQSSPNSSSGKKGKK